MRPREPRPWSLMLDLVAPLAGVLLGLSIVSSVLTILRSCH